MEKKYEPKKIEKKWLKKTVTYKNEMNYKLIPFSIILPPPNITGNLHMGHAFQTTIMDILIKLNKMENKNTFWKGGVDHAGIATQIIIERKLEKNNKSRIKMGRKKFLEVIWLWSKKSKKNIILQLKRLGASINWINIQFTMEKKPSEAVEKAFIDLYKENLIYKGKKIVNWDPKLKTVISDLEVIQKKIKGSLWYINYEIVNSKKKITVATTRPETMFGDTAIAINPKDNRYKNLVGKKIKIPLCNRIIPVIKDEKIKINFGTGCVKITPAHDKNDYEISKKHKLEIIDILNNECKMNKNTPQKYQNLDILEARKIVVQDLKLKKLLEKIETHTINISIGDRTLSPIEPRLTEQWYLKTKELSNNALKTIQEGKIKFFPKKWEKVFIKWMNNIQDWCISRQLWWGHRIPVWYDINKNIYLGKNLKDIKKKYKLKKNTKLIQDLDVLDTWFSSSLWPFSSLGWPEKTKELNNFFPSDILVTGFDIIFFWVSRMIMLSLKLTNKIPFKIVYIHGLIQDQKGNKMSKSKGNILDPIDLIDGIKIEELIKKRTDNLFNPKMSKKIEEITKKNFPNGISEYGTDALRLTFSNMSIKNNYMKFDIGKLKGNKNYCNKMWNAGRFILINNKKHIRKTKDNYSTINSWIISKWERTKKKIETNKKNYRFDLMSKNIYNFFWNEYCSWYLELYKIIINLKEKNMNFQTTSLRILKEIMIITYPIMPYITSEIFKILSKIDKETNNEINKNKIPKFNKNLININDEKEIKQIQEIITELRNLKNELKIDKKTKLKIILDEKIDNTIFIKYKNIFFHMFKINYIKKTKKQKFLKISINKDIHILLSTNNIINNIQLFNNSIQIKLKKIKENIEKIKNKLKNENFLKNAKKEIIKKEKEKFKILVNQLNKYEENEKILKEFTRN